MTINWNIEAAKAELAQRKAAQTRPDRERALSELSSILDADMSIELFVGICHALCEKPWVRNSVAQITLREVLQDPAPKKRAKRAKVTDRKRSSSTKAAMDAITNVLKASDTSMSKGEIFDAALKAHGDLTALKSAWTVVRTTLRAHGKGRTMRYLMGKMQGT